MGSADSTAFERLTGALSAARNRGDDPPPRGEYRFGEIQPLREFRTGAVPRETGFASLTLEDGKLCARGAFRDFDIYNDAVRDNEETWLLGDAFELIFGREGRRDYFEVHATPEGRKLQLHLPDHRTFRAIPHGEKLCELGLQVRTEVRRAENLWLAELTVPLAATGITPEEARTELRFVLVRQNHTRGRLPEITAGRIFPETAHDPCRWHKVHR